MFVITGARSIYNIGTNVSSDGLSPCCCDRVRSIGISAGRAFSAGKDPTIPALHCSITSLGPLAIKRGEPITGKLRC